MVLKHVNVLRQIHTECEKHIVQNFVTNYIIVSSYANTSALICEADHHYNWQAACLGSLVVLDGYTTGLLAVLQSAVHRSATFTQLHRPEYPFWHPQ